MATKIREIEGPYDIIPVRQLIVGTRLPCDIFIRKRNSTIVFLNKGDYYTNISRDILKEKSISEVYIQVRDVRDFEFYLSRNRSLSQTGDTGATEAFNKYSYNKEQFYQIDPALIMPGSKINFGLSLLVGLNFSSLIDASDDAPAEVNDGILDADGDILIKKSDLLRYHEYISMLQQSVELPESDKLRIKTLALKEVTKIVLQDFFADPRSGKKINEINTLVNDMIDRIMENRDIIYTLLSLKGYDYYTYAHSVNVAALSVSLGIAAGLRRGDNENLGMGAILHDIGKSAIPHEILNKKGRLSNVEFNIFKNHVLEGEKIMRQHDNFPEESFSVIMQHHEKLSGKGYPYGLSGGKIALPGRIAAIADYYDILTTGSPYKVACKPFEALSKMSGEKGDFDPDLLKIFIIMLGRI